MLVICYGLQKSASSFCFRLISDVLEEAGHPQLRFRRTFLKNLPLSTPGGITSTSQKCMEPLLAEAEDRWLVVKTHSILTPIVREKISERSMRAFVTFRDPADSALSMFEHAERNRANGDAAGRSFGAKIFTLEDAIAHVAEMLPRLREWCSCPNVVAFSYDAISDDPAGVCATIADELGFDVDVEKIIFRYHSGEEKIPNFNVGKKGRFDHVATEAQKRMAEKIFRSTGWPFFE